MSQQVEGGFWACCILTQPASCHEAAQELQLLLRRCLVLPFAQVSPCNFKPHGTFGIFSVPCRRIDKKYRQMEKLGAFPLHHWAWFFFVWNKMHRLHKAQSGFWATLNSVWHSFIDGPIANSKGGLYHPLYAFCEGSSRWSKPWNAMDGYSTKKRSEERSCRT